MALCGPDVDQIGCSAPRLWTCPQVTVCYHWVTGTVGKAVVPVSLKRSSCSGPMAGSPGLGAGRGGNSARSEGGRDVWAGRVRVSLLHHGAVPPQHGVGSHDQPRSAQGLTREGLEQCGEEGPVLLCELRFPGVELSLQDADLVAKREDLGVVGPVAYRQQSQ